MFGTCTRIKTSDQETNSQLAQEHRHNLNKLWTFTIVRRIIGLVWWYNHITFPCPFSWCNNFLLCKWVSICSRWIITVILFMYRIEHSNQNSLPGFIFEPLTSCTGCSWIELSESIADPDLTVSADSSVGVWAGGQNIQISKINIRIGMNMQNYWHDETEEHVYVPESASWLSIFIK